MDSVGIELNPDKQIGLAQKPDIRKVLHKGSDVEELDSDTKIVTKDPEGLVQRNIVDKGILSTIGKKVTQGAKAAGEGLTKLGERVAGEGGAAAKQGASNVADIVAPGSTRDVVGQAMKKIGSTISQNPEATAAAAGAGTIGYMAGGSGKDPQYKEVEGGIEIKGKFNLAGDRVARSLIGAVPGAAAGAAVGAATDPVDAVGGAKRGAIFGGIGGATGGLLAKVGAGGRAVRHFGSTTRDTLKAEARRIPKAGLVGGVMGEAILDKGIKSKGALDDPVGFLENKVVRAAGKKAGGKIVGGVLAIADKAKNAIEKGIETKTLRERIAKRVVDFAKPHLERIAEPTIQRVENAARGEVASQSAAMRPHIEAAARDEVAKQSAQIRKDLVREVGDKTKLATGIGAGAGAVVGGTAGALLGRKVQEKGFIGNAVKKLRGVAQSPFEGSVMQARQQAGRHLKKNMISSEERAARGHQRKLDDILSTTAEFNAAQARTAEQRHRDYMTGASDREDMGRRAFFNDLSHEEKRNWNLGHQDMDSHDYLTASGKRIPAKKGVGSHLLAGAAGVAGGLALAHEMNKPEEAVSMRGKIERADKEHRKLGPPNFKNVHVPLKGQTKTGKK
jgi:hypothetical protein